MRKKIWIILSCVLGAVVVAVGALSYTYARRARAAENTLRTLYENAALSAISHLGDLQDYIDKALLSQDMGASAQLLSKVSSGATGVRQSLQLLPVMDDGERAALKFANQLQDYADALQRQVEAGVTDAQYQTLENLSAACENMMTALTQARTAWENDNVGTGERTLHDDQVTYPTLIYDGPFSDAEAEVTSAQLAQLPEITREQALEKAKAFLGDTAQSVQEGTDSFGPIPCYGVTAQLDGIQVQLAVTKQGGKVLWMFPEHADFDMLKSVEECRQNALAFLESRGYPGMEPLYFEVYGGLAVINFAAVQGDVLLYPDQVKVQVRMDNGSVIGIESRSYLLHHRDRAALTPAITAEEAEGNVSEKLTLTRDARLCLIPKNGEEVLCYEFAGEYGGEQYLVYMNAQTGAQQEILKVVETSGGLNAV